MLEPTGERLVPDRQRGELVLAEHLARYRLAARLAADRRVLDAACGEGYGSAMLAAARAASVIGIDIDAETVVHARERYGIDAREGDVEELPLPDGSVDLVVSFETIEHVAHPERAIDEFRRVLAPGGLLLISTPNAREYHDDNEFHVREFEPDEFAALLGAHFGSVERLYQQNLLASAVFDASRTGESDEASAFPVEFVSLASAVPGRELYTLAVCGDEPVPLEADLVVATGIYEAQALARLFREWQHRATEAERVQAEWEARATEAERIQAEWEARATEAERIRSEWEARATEAERQVAEFERQVAELRATLERIAASMSWRITKPLRSLKGLTR